MDRDVMHPYPSIQLFLTKQMTEQNKTIWNELLDELENPITFIPQQSSTKQSLTKI